MMWMVVSAALWVESAEVVGYLKVCAWAVAVEGTTLSLLLQSCFLLFQ